MAKEEKHYPLEEAKHLAKLYARRLIYGINHEKNKGNEIPISIEGRREKMIDLTGQQNDYVTVDELMNRTAFIDNEEIHDWTEDDK